MGHAACSLFCELRAVELPHHPVPLTPIPDLSAKRLHHGRKMANSGVLSRVTFPDSIAGHTRNQVSYFGPDGLLRRHEYTVDVLGNAPGLNYASDYRAANGLMVRS